jgi:topoisomerase-4 subunit A
VAVVGSNRKLLIFPLGELPVMTRGRGVIVQRYSRGELSDLTTFARAEGLSWRFGSGVRTETDLATWCGKRGQVGQKVPRGFPLANRFT